MKGKRLLFFAEILLFVVFTNILFFMNAMIEPLVPWVQSIKRTFPFVIITIFFLWLCFKLIEYYYFQTFRYVNLMEELNNSLLKLSSDLKIEKLLKNSLEILMNFYKGNTGITIIFDEEIKKFTSTDIFVINTGSTNEGRIQNYSLFTFFPGKIEKDEEKKIKQTIDEYGLDRCNVIITIPVFNNRVKIVNLIGIQTNKRKETLKQCEELKTIIEIFIKHLNLEIENSLLHEAINYASITDPLTGLYNRRYFSLRLKEEFAKAKREGFPISIMISDLDNFKNYVDTYGHPKGDIILKELADVIKSSLRESDIICRFGGDEFAYLLPFSSSLEAKTVAERVIKNVQSYKFLENIVAEEVHLTLSIGIASFPEHGMNEDEILSKADHALFMAKNMGKNRVLIYPSTGG